MQTQTPTETREYTALVVLRYLLEQSKAYGLPASNFALQQAEALLEKRANIVGKFE